MVGYAKIMVIGRLGAEPEMRFTATGKAVCSFPVAVNSGSRDKQQTEWFTAVAWERLAEICNEHLTKGAQVFIEGNFKTRSWEGRDGQKRQRNEIGVQQIRFLSVESQEEDPTNDGEDGS